MFDQAFDIVVGLEGGYVYDPRDPGGETKYGISKRSYPHLDITQLALAEAKEIYRKDFWEAGNCDWMEPGFALVFFDMAVNCGLSAALKLRQTHPSFDGFIAGRIAYYADLKNFSVFGRGWMRRLAQVVQAANKLRQGKHFEVLVMNSNSAPIITRKPFVASLDGKPLEGRKLDIRFL